MITVNIDKAKLVAHNIRRVARAQEFAPLDIKATIPNESIVAEKERQNIREKYADMQFKIDNAKTANEIKFALGSLLMEK